MRKIIFALLASMMIQNMKSQLKVAGVDVPYIYKTSESVLKLNGAGIREKYFMDMYVGALYLKERQSNQKHIIEADETMCIKLHIVSGLITSDKMVSAVEEGFEKSTNKNTQPLRDKIEQFKKVFSEKVNKGDIYDIVYEEKVGTVIYKNGVKKDVIAGLGFKKALFGIWFCDKPADSNLKKKMLGQ
ncbi:MAG: chalcone isomerase family protein [Bacteroidia bacterium]